MLCRDLVAILFSAALMSCAAHAAPARKVGVITPWEAGNPQEARRIAELRDELGKRGLRVGEQIELHVERGGSDFERTRRALLEAAAAGVDAVVCLSSECAHLAVRAIDRPVVFMGYTDPVADGIAESWSRPGGRVTGYTAFLPLEDKRLQMLRDAFPQARRLAVLEDGASRLTGAQRERLEATLRA